jgi:N-acetylmuramoyl-L-alanine amidase
VWLALLAALPGVADAARPGMLEFRGRGGPLGQLPLIVVDDGTSYVSAARLARVLKGQWSVKGPRGTLSVGKRSVQFTWNQSRAIVTGQAVKLESAPRVSASDWLLPEDFLAKGLARLAPGVTASKAPAPRPPAKPTRAARPTVALEELRYRSYPSFTRVVVESAGALAHAVSADRGEVRVRLGGLSLPGPHVEEVDDGLVKELRLEPVGGEAVLRAILDGQAGEVKDMVLEDPHRVVIDIHRPKEPAPREGGSPSRAQSLRLIVLDAGHGGHDPGAIGPSGLTEKEVVLDVTRRVARMAEDGLGLKVALTRESDAFVPLRDRTNFANKQRADLFVSIHANAHPRSVSEGVETYFLSSEATDNEARQVAALENGVVQLEGAQSRQKFNVLKSILWELAQSEFQEESSFLAETVQDSMTRSLRLVNRGVKQAGFYVLGGAAMPAILIEIGFITNPREEKKLATPEHREAVARAIHAGLSEYRRRYNQRMRMTDAAPAKSVAAPGKAEATR